MTTFFLGVLSAPFIRKSWEAAIEYHRTVPGLISVLRKDGVSTRVEAKDWKRIFFGKFVK